MENDKSYSFGDLPIKELLYASSVELDENDEGDELSHAGIKGMKWGVRRYQNKDGSLTEAGKKRYNKELAKVREAEKILKNKQATKAKLDKLEARKKAVEEGEAEIEAYSSSNKSKTRNKAANTTPNNSPSKSKSAKDMSDEELKAAIDRLNLEKQFRQLQSEMSPKKAGRGKRFADQFKDETVDKLSKNVAADLVAQTAKAVGVSFTNKMLNNVLDPDGDGKQKYVYTNNQKK